MRSGGNGDLFLRSRAGRARATTIALCLAAISGLPLDSHSADVSYEYDAAGRLKRTTYTDPAVATVDYVLDAAGNRTSVVTAIQNSYGTLQFNPTSYTISETGAVVNLTVTRTGGANGAIGVNYATANSTAVAGLDYTSTSGTLSWAHGDASSRTISVSISTDGLSEGNEVFTVELSSPSGGAGLGTASAAVTISDSTGSNANAAVIAVIISYLLDL